MKITYKAGAIEIPLYFGMVAIEEISKSQLSSIPGWNKLLVDIVWGGYVNACALQREAPAKSYEEIMLLMDETEESNINEIVIAFNQSKAGTRLFESVENKEGKPSPSSQQKEAMESVPFSPTDKHRPSTSKKKKTLISGEISSSSPLGN